MNTEDLKSIPLLQQLDDDELLLMSKYIKFLEIKRNELVFREFEPGNSLYIIKNGFVKIVKAAHDGSEKVLSVFKNGDFFGEMALFDGKPRSAGAKTSCDTELWEISKSDFVQIIRESPVTALKLVTSLVKHLSERFRSIDDKLVEAFDWGSDIRDWTKKIKKIVEREVEVKVLLVSDRDIVGKVVSFENGPGGIEIVLVDGSGHQFLIPYHAVQYIMTKGLSGHF